MTHPTPRTTVGSPQGAFSLVELMIGIVILGLGMVMVATLFPVAWGRARTLSEFTIQRNMVENAQATVQALVRVTGPSFASAGFAGDLVYDSTSQTLYTPDLNWPNDTWVHALNLENIQVSPRAFVDEDPWQIEAPAGALGISGLPARSYLAKQIRFHQRVYPPMDPRHDVDAAGVFTAPDPRWDDALDTRRFCWAAFHRRRERVSVDPAGDPEAAAGTVAAPRVFDMYYVILRRPQPTFRYAKQDPAFVPDPYALTQTPARPAALGPANDVLFPVPWRVQVQFPGTLALRLDPNTGLPTGNATGIPTEVQVPPDNVTGATAAMLVQMFPKGTRFIDEITGRVFRVVKRRITDAAGEQAVLTLDREVVIEDLDLPLNDLRCTACAPGTLEPEELLRTVWVFPPPVQPGRAPGAPLTFAGGGPVVGIEVRTLNVAPTP